MNEVGSFAFYAVMGLVAVVFVIAALRYSQSSLKASYQRLASRFNGQFRFHGWNDPRARFVHKGMRVLVNVSSTRGQHPAHFTQFQTLWTDMQFRCEVYPEGFWSRFHKFLGMRDIEIGVPRFDDDYVITSNNRDLVRDFLTLQVQSDLDQLRSLGVGTNSFQMQTERTVVGGDIYLSISGGHVLIKKRGLLREYEQLERFVDLCLQLYDHAVAASSEGIEFVEPQPEAVLSLDEAVCQICGETVKLDPVLCRSCKTPHHKDCWEYYGACSTYGCGQQKYSSRS